MRRIDSGEEAERICREASMLHGKQRKEKGSKHDVSFVKVYRGRTYGI